MQGKRRRRILCFLLSVILILILLVLLTPLWFPWVLRPTAKRFGATFRAYQRIGYLEFAVTDVLYTNRNVRVQAGHLAVAPLRHAAKAENWSVIVTPSKQTSTNAASSVHRVYNQVFRIVTNVQHRLPQAALTNGFVQTPHVIVSIPGVRWTGTNFFGQAQISNAVPLTTVRAKLPPVGPVELELLSPAIAPDIPPPAT